MKKQSKAQRQKMAVAICMDALKQLACGQYTAQKGVYVRTEKTIPNDHKKAQQFCRVEPCSVCVKGALLVSRVAKYDGISGLEIEESDGASIPVSVPEIPLHIHHEAEALFERWCHKYGDFRFRAFVYNCLPESESDRMEWILRRLIHTKCEKLVLNHKTGELFEEFKRLSPTDRRLLPTEVKF